MSKMYAYLKCICMSEIYMHVRNIYACGKYMNIYACQEYMHIKNIYACQKYMHVFSAS